MKYEFKKGDYVVVKKKLTSISIESKKEKIGQILKIKKVRKGYCYDKTTKNKTFKFIYEINEFNWCREELKKLTKKEISEYVADEL